MKLKELEKKYKDLGEEIERLKKQGEKIDFSKFVGRWGDILCIFGEKMLKSFNDLDIVYNNELREDYEDELHYEHTTLDKLEYGDVFICEDDVEGMELSDFNIFMGTDKDGDYVYQFLDQQYGLEKISDDLYTDHYKIIKFLRN